MSIGLRIFGVGMILVVVSALVFGRRRQHPPAAMEESGHEGASDPDRSQGTFSGRAVGCPSGAVVPPGGFGPEQRGPVRSRAPRDGLRRGTGGHGDSGRSID